MRNERFVLSCFITGIAAVAASVFFLGCETATTDQDVAVLQIQPQTAYLQGEGTSVLFTVTAKAYVDVGQGTSTTLTGKIYLPLQWSVSRPDLGRIAQETGNQALYVKVPGTEGQNVVNVRDQGGSEGMAVVNQQP
ncbi:MAG: hypothetical protein FJ224_09140 [Lentisphaerae bacterium]|nr:hypothetical protein [Lentisphaerota bacterium]